MLARLFFLVAAVACSPAMSATLTYDFTLQFERDRIQELQFGFENGDRCFVGNACFPDNFRHPDAAFRDLAFGNSVSASFTLDTATNTMTGRIGDWNNLPDTFSTRSSARVPLRFSLFNSTSETLSVDVERLLITYSSEGPRGNNPPGICNPSAADPSLPNGACGFFGYDAQFRIQALTVFDGNGTRLTSIAPVPLPASVWLLGFGIACLGGWRAFTRCSARH